MAADHFMLCFLIVICLQTGVSRANDNAPSFMEGTTRTTVSESTEGGTVVFSDIIIRDQDSDNPYLTVSCAEQERQYDACEYFMLEPTIVATTQEWRGQIKLRQQLDYEAFPIYEVTIAAHDSLYTQYQTYTIDVTNVHDMRPVFSDSLTGSVREDVPVGTAVLQVTATDGDNLGAQIRYILKNHTDPEKYFQIGFESGVISTTKTLDRESLTDGRVTLQVQATELMPDGTLGSGELYFRVADVHISVTDVNDNVPVFSPEEHTIVMSENLANGAAIPDLNIRVVDYDQGANAEFSLRLLDYTDIFDIQPNEGREALAASIIIRNSSKLDFDFGMRQYIIRMVAEEKGGSGRQNTGQITINLEDVNDYHPVFDEEFYTATIPETAVEPYEVITVQARDLDQTDYYGGPSIRYKLRTAEGGRPTQFVVNRITGKVTVERARGCYEAGQANCLDADVKNFYNLFVTATDSYSEGHSTTVPLNISIQDVNDNRPHIEVPDYVSYIIEEQTVPDPEVFVKAEDGDRKDGLYSQITYTIVGGQPTPTGLWSIDSQTGYVQATTGVPYPPSGRYVLSVEANDNYGLSDTATVTIIVEDINNHSPVFDQNGLFVESIPEDTPPGTTVLTVTAQDNDAPDTPNGILLYRIISGARGKFNIDENTGVLTVAPGATFDYDIQNLYNITVVAEDQGNPQRSSPGIVIVHILDANNKNPVFRPTTFRVDVLENEPVGSPVVTVTAQDQDKDAQLVYSIIGPYRAWDSLNAEIPENQDIQGWFTVDRSTGEVTVNDKLEHDRVVRWSAFVKVHDVNGGPEQTATGLLIINIIEVNDRPPVFALPWTPEIPHIFINVREGQAKGSYVTTLIASDPSNGIDRFNLFSIPGGYFDLDEETGVVTIGTPIDYEEVQTTQFVVGAIDNGQPPLTATATVNVVIENVNDETPELSLNQYEKSIPENSPAGFSVVRVIATDKDKGDYGVIRYQIDDPQNNFIIDPISGWITVAEGAVLDSETQRLIVVTAQAYDSPKDADVRKLVSAPVYITLTDVNEFPPKFSRTVYNAVIPETSPADSSVIQLTATDDDYSDNEYNFFEMGGDPNDLFTVHPTTGLVTTKRKLEDSSGVYNLSVQVRNNGGGSANTNMAFIEITVLEMENPPPFWTFPNPDNQTVEIMENQPVGTRVVQVLAEDNDMGINGMVDYSFDVNGVIVNQTEDFSINGLTGVITALRSFDREKKDVYILSLVARDRGRPVGEAKQTLVIRILDVEDNKPQFPMHRNCCTISFHMSMSENTSVGVLVATVQAKDKDIGERAIIQYSIEAGNEERKFQINSETGEIHLVNQTDHETTDRYALLIKASNPMPGKNSGNMGGQCHANCTDSSTVYLYIDILDYNEKSPVFSSDIFDSCVSAKARFNTEVTQISAIDPDKKSSEGVTYRLNELELIPEANRVFSKDTFIMHNETGVIRTNALMEMYTNSYFKLRIQASDNENTPTVATVRIFVTTSDKEVVVTLNQPKHEVEADLDAQIRAISEVTGYNIVCINSIRVHVDKEGGGTVDITRTDLYLHVIDPDTLLIVDPDRVRAKLQGITGAVVLASASQWTGFIRDPVLIAIIIVAVLLFIALLCLCCFCWCWAAIFKKRQKYVEAPIVLNAGTINPLWKGFEVQELSMAVPDAEAKLRAMSGFANVGYDHTDASIQKTQMSNGYMASYEETRMAESALSGASTRIEADLLRNAASNTIMAGSSSLGMGTITQGVQTDDMASTLNMSTEYLVPGSPSRIGATLTRNDWQGQYNTGYDHEMDNEAYTMSDGRSVGIQTFHASRTYTQDYHDEGTYPSGVEVDNDYPDSFYQGEIHLGSLPPPRSTSHSQTQYTTSTQEFHNSYEADGEIEYITF